MSNPKAAQDQLPCFGLEIAYHHSWRQRIAIDIVRTEILDAICNSIQSLGRLQTAMQAT